VTVHHRAIIIQDHTDYLPLGLFTGAATPRQTVDGCPVATARAGFPADRALQRAGADGRLHSRVYVSIAILEGLLIFADQLRDRQSNGRLGQYYEVQNPPSSRHSEEEFQRQTRARVPGV
jgi:hypothetical protein